MAVPPYIMSVLNQPFHKLIHGGFDSVILARILQRCAPVVWWDIPKNKIIIISPSLVKKQTAS